MTVLIAIPYYGVPADMIDKAVRHALAQTHSETIVMVLGDGQKPPVSFTHDRLIVDMIPEHHGAPFVQQAMILGSPFEWYAPHGADDWIEPDHIKSLLALGARVNGSGVIWYDQAGKRPQLFRSSRTYIEFGVLDTSMLRAIGGYNAAEPCGQDSVLISLLAQTEVVRLSRRPTYHKVHRADSLTHHPDTRGGSPLRTGVRIRNRAILLECARKGRDRVAIKDYRASLLSPEVAGALEDAAALVARRLT
ncbi:MAG: hypothetical protein ABI622_08830 [Chloroflexota bacterium]